MEYSSARHSFYGFKHEFRQQRFDPTTLVILSFETIDLSDNLPKIAGYSFFPLFVDRSSQLPVTDPANQNWALHKGAFQMGVFCQRPQFVTPFTYENFVFGHRCQTTTVLVRCFRAPKTNAGMTLGLADVP